MSTEHYSSSPEISLASTSSTEKDSLFFGSRIAISPDGEQIVTFSPESHKFKLYNIGDLSNPIFEIESGIYDKHLYWSFAISNRVNVDERLIAFSCFDASEFRHDEAHLDDKNDGDKINNKNDEESCNVKYLTQVISTLDGKEIHNSLEGGITRFLDSGDGDQSLIIINASGIIKETIEKKKRIQFELPQQLSNLLSRDLKDSLELLHTSIIKNHFMVHSFENRQQIIEMYSLITGDLEMLFKRHEYSVAPNIIHGSPIFAISQNEKILAFCETTSITLYLMGNSLEITTKQFKCQRGIYKIADINFMDADSKLLIVLEEKEDRRRGEISKNHQIFVVWDLFTTFENSVRQIDNSETKEPLKMDVTLGLMNSYGNVFAVKDGGDIFSVLDLPAVTSIINPSAKATTEIDVKMKDPIYHAIYNINGERFDASKLEENRIIIANVEPWHLDKNYFRISVYLDSTESTQLIISHNTIQVWKKYCRTNIEKQEHVRVLEYIWARNKMIDVQELKIGEREFKLEVSIPSSTPSEPPKLKTIHWPNNINVLEGACRALFVLVKDGGDIFSVLDLPAVTSIINPSAKATTEIDVKMKDPIYHAIYNINGERFDASKLEENRIIIANVEPWHLDKNYFRISVYLDSTESTQLIISHNTIQVWKKYCRTNIEKQEHVRVLEYIWARNKMIDVQELKIGEREFKLEVSIPSSTPSEPPKLKTIHWPNNINVLEGACRALFVLGEKKLSKANFDNVNQIKYLVECTQRLVRKYIIRYGIFRLTSIRYPIMKYLIKSNQESLINDILNKKIGSKNGNIYIPRLYKWPDEDNRSTTEIPKSDLHLAILSQKRGDSTVILKYLIDYYADNAKEYNNPGWMFTVSKAIPLLYDYNLREFVQYLFKKPCFGITEAYTPPLHINSYDQRKGNSATVIRSLVANPRLTSKSRNTLWFLKNPLFCLKNQFTRIIENLKTLLDLKKNEESSRKVYVVPLSHFTVYPNSVDLEPNSLGLEDSSENYSKYFWYLFRVSLWPRRKVIKDPKDMSPFLRVMHEEKDYEIYRTPAIMAVLDFKWLTARQYFGELNIVNLFKKDSNILLTTFFFIYLYTVLLLPLADIAFILFHQRHTFLFNSVLAFTILVLWFELILLLRYLEIPGRYIYIIYSISTTIWPFLLFMLIAILAFSHAMFTFINLDDPGISYPTYKIQDTSNLDLYSNITIYQDVDKSSRLDNYYSHFISSVEAVFFWTNGRWDQLGQWDYPAVDVLSILGSLILVLIFQNMLIAFMNGAFDKANKAGRTAAYKYRADLTAEYEALENPFTKKENPKYIYYIPDPDVINTWLKETKKDENQELRHMDAELTDFDYDDNDDENEDNSKKYQNEGSSSTMDKISFIDEDIFPLKVDYQSSMQEKFNNLENEFKTRFDELDQNLKTILQTLSNLNNPK
ncbi:hypothetical protein Glove_139g216 [Diversispora epigaea]|uniref:Ion transport domain-containing protein n=1 Tax=Diversispora epigaea TaxID=1348612 RepID=A0A397IVI8_9GLOM|nr:hypothetical protein Glove_139g216 [Diversispora epigaea]